MKHKMTKAMGSCVLASMILIGTAEAQSSEALLKTLVKKGVITEAEADELRKETTQGSKVAVRDWVERISFKGDLRFRFENFNNAGAGNTKPARERFRYRFRYGVTTTLNDDWKIGFRLASGGTGNSVSTNETMDDDGGNDDLNIDQAYAAWTPGDDMKLTFGKMPNPLRLDDAVWDSDYTPEGVAFNYAYELSQNHKVGVALGGIFVDESSNNSSDAYAGLAQVTLDSVLTSKLSSYLGVAAYNLFNKESALEDGGGNKGNTGGDAPTNNMNPFIVDGALTYKLDSFPMYPGAFPISVGGTYINNPGADNKEEGYLVTVKFGKAKKVGAWEVGYQFRELQADSLYDNWVADDYGAYGVGGDSNAYYGGTDVRGHAVHIKYQLTDSMQCAARVMRTEAITTDSHGTIRGQFDLIWSF
jgi:hypothetical protein|tara:strand:- start:1021 stop:2271 length:1251 start_codon:yes stop_codon:yes gene_type:complete